MLSAVCLLSMATAAMSRGQNHSVLPIETNTANKLALKWKDINISLPQNTSHQVVGYDGDKERVYLLGGKNVENEYWTLDFKQPYEGWAANEKTRFETLKILEYQQSYFSSRHNIIYIKTGGFIHIFDLELYYFNENVIELPVHIMDGCLTVYYDADADIEYLIIIGSKLERKPSEPSTWIYKVNAATHNITFFDIGPDLLGIRENFCCTIMDDYLYVIGGVYDTAQTRFIEQWKIDINTAYSSNEQGVDAKFDNFTNVNTLINAGIATHYLPQYGHRCLVNQDKGHLYIVGGITEEIDSFELGSTFNYSKYVLVIQRENNTLYEINYTEKEDLEQGRAELASNAAPRGEARVLPSLPVPMAYTAVMLDKYGYLNLFGGEIDPDTSINKWYRVNTNDDDIGNEDQIDLIWRGRKKHNHNEQWAILILLIMIVMVGIWFKCMSTITKLKNGAASLISKRNGRGLFSDGTVYDEITATSEAEDIEPNAQDIDDDNAVSHGPSSGDENNYLNGIIAKVDHLEQVHDEDVEHNAEVVA